MGSVKSMCRGRLSVLDVYVLIILGHERPSVGERGRGKPRFLARWRRRMGL
jgi:hypothetical protein